MDGLFHGKPYFLMDDLGGFLPPLFLVQHPYNIGLCHVDTHPKPVKRPHNKLNIPAGVGWRAEPELQSIATTNPWIPDALYGTNGIFTYEFAINCQAI